MQRSTGRYPTDIEYQISKVKQMQKTMSMTRRFLSHAEPSSGGFCDSAQMKAKFVRIKNDAARVKPGWCSILRMTD